MCCSRLAWTDVSLRLNLCIEREILLGHVGDHHDAKGAQIRLISLTDVKRWISDIDWSAANGKLLVAANDQQGRYTIWTVLPDGSQQTRVHVETAEISTARWTRDGRAVYYHRRVEQTPSILKLQLPDREDRIIEPTVLITGLETDGSLGISDDGGRLVYARAPYFSTLWSVDLPVLGKLHATALTNGTWRTERPRVSPDGRRIVFTVGYEDRANLYTMPLDGGTPKQLTFLDSFNVGARRLTSRFKHLVEFPRGADGLFLEGRPEPPHIMSGGRVRPVRNF
jgi:Tol biopolymer transport system component